jgi:hypothetical protein
MSLKSRSLLPATGGHADATKRAGWLARALVVSLLSVVLGPAARAQSLENGGDGRQWAVLIGIEKYQKAQPLQFTINDVRQLAETLRGRGGFDGKCIFEVTDDEPDPDRRPSRASLLAGLPRWLEKPAADERLIVYFSGHGFRDKSGKLYLAPIDCDPADPAKTGISVEWFRKQIADCKAGFKFLILDACHAGSDKGDGTPTAVPLKEIGEMFRDVSRVITLASSTEEEKSQIWDEKRQSLFSYWLNQGLKGHADSDGDGAVSVDELNDYVHRNVTRTAKVRFNRPQTPVRLIRIGTGSPDVVKLQPLKLKKLLADIADQLALAIEEQRLAALAQKQPDPAWESPRLGVLEFCMEYGSASAVGADLGNAGRWCSEELEKRLLDAGGGKIQVVEYHTLLEALSENKVSVKDVHKSKEWQPVANKLGGMPAIALGRVKARSGQLVSLVCKVVCTSNDNLVGSAGGTAVLSESDWAMFPQSVWVQPDDRRPAMPGSKDDSVPHNDLVLKRLDQRAKGPHPMQDPSFPFRVSIVVNGTARPAFFKNNDLYVPVRKGEEYAVRVENRSGQPACMRLLVDGLNTLPEPENTKGVATMALAKRVSLESARHWILDPAVSPSNTVPGFVSATGENGKLGLFKVTDVEKSLAARQHFTEQIGLITAAFYEPVPSKGGNSRGVGTTTGDERSVPLRERSDLDPGNLIAVVNIHYVDADELNSPAQ